jgi:hypothetical protein
MNVKIHESGFIEEIETNKRVVVSGMAGSGKSTFCRSIFLELIENPRGIFPIFIELRHLNSESEKSLFDFVLETLSDIEPTFSKIQLEHSLKLGKVLLIFDGFDEINNDKRDLYEKEIVSIAGRYHNIMIMVSSRPDDRFTSWDEFFCYNILPLDKEKAKSLIAKLNYDRKVKLQFLAALDADLYDKHISFSRNPLLLTMMLLTYEQIAEIPNKIHLFYEQAFLTLFNKHDSLKSLYKIKSFSGLPLDDFRKLLASFSILSYSDRKYSFTEAGVIIYIEKAIGISGIVTEPQSFLNDLLDSVCIMQRDGLGFTFTHRSFQEYFTAMYLVNMANKNRFEIFDKIAFTNDTDDVIPMIYDVNGDLLEQEWLIPKAEDFVRELSVIPNSKEGELVAFSKVFNGLDIHKSPSDEIMIAYQISEEDKNRWEFINLVTRIYSSEFNDYLEDKDSEANTELFKSLFDNDSKNGQFINLTKIDEIDDKTKSIIIESGILGFITQRLNFIKEMLNKLQGRHKEKHSDIADLLLGG